MIAYTSVSHKMLRAESHRRGQDVFEDLHGRRTEQMAATAPMQFETHHLPGCADLALSSVEDGGNGAPPFASATRDLQNSEKVSQALRTSAHGTTTTPSQAAFALQPHSPPLPLAAVPA